MKRAHELSALSTAGVVLLAALCQAQAAPPGASAGDRVCLRLGLNADIGKILQATGAILLHHQASSDIYLLRTAKGQDAAGLVKSIGPGQGVTWAQPDRIAHAPESECQQPTGYGGDVAAEQCTIGFVDGLAPSSAYASLLTYYEQGWLDQIWVSLIQTYGYQKTVVAVIDTGLDLAHPIFAGRLMSDGFDYIGEKPGAWDGPDGKDSDLDGNVDEGVGHGSHVAGTVLRTNPNALILPLRVLDSDGMGYGYNVARAIHNAVDAGARIINLSLGMLEPSEPVNLALDYADAKGVTVFAAAGNTGAQKVLFPANRPSPYKPSLPEHARGVIAITAVDALDVKSSFAAWGKEVNLCAPGAKICGPTWGGGYAFWSGTSMATAVASGSASMILTLVPTYPETPAKPMVNGADKLDPKSALTPLLGAGRVNVLRAMGEVIYGWTPP